jgi:hypothetical protein
VVPSIGSIFSGAAVRLDFSLAAGFMTQIF